MPILHVTHLRADADGFASAYWGYKVFGGGLYIPEPDSTVQNLMKKLKVKNVIPPVVVGFHVYDTCDSKKLPFFVFNYSVFDHHKVEDEDFLKSSVFSYVKPRTANVMNLYDLSEGKLEDDVLFVFAVALVTDTGFLKTAKEEELFYLSKFLKKRPLEEVFTVVFSGKIKNWQSFVRHLNNMKIFSKPKIAFVECDDDDEFLIIIDTLMYPLDIAVFVGKLPWGLWVYCRKDMMQKIYQKVLRDFPNRDAGRLYNQHNVDDLIERIEKAIES
ncbi:hypothetical protein [Pseudothermotoga thermarum]|uniref:Uncharacterized protein n=1 Tax=Pseudothermotoga thermarum DSM 5069 TaxID=688269 RepID=F7YUP3_9THEM|nr:hypothetical protein [Pseudothermotoga thermarum]AEH50228.1 hypothetical protein Theth_0124 [Pseudothermotoga thermarum DSM 5069]